MFSKKKKITKIKMNKKINMIKNDYFLIMLLKINN